MLYEYIKWYVIDSYKEGCGLLKWRISNYWFYFYNSGLLYKLFSIFFILTLVWPTVFILKCCYFLFKKVFFFIFYLIDKIILIYCDNENKKVIFFYRFFKFVEKIFSYLFYFFEIFYLGINFYFIIMFVMDDDEFEELWAKVVDKLEWYIILSLEFIELRLVYFIIWVDKQDFPRRYIIWESKMYSFFRYIRYLKWLFFAYIRGIRRYIIAWIYYIIGIIKFKIKIYLFLFKGYTSLYYEKLRFYFEEFLWDIKIRIIKCSRLWSGFYLATRRQKYLFLYYTFFYFFTYLNIRLRQLVAYIFHLFKCAIFSRNNIILLFIFFKIIFFFFFDNII